MPDPIIFGKHTVEDAQARLSVNPCVNALGRGPNDRQCRSCVFFRDGGVKARCALIPRHRHRADWPACERYKQKI